MIVIDKLTSEKILSQPLQTNIQQLRIAITVLTGYNGIFDVTTRNNINIFISVSECFENNAIRIPPATFDVEILIKGIKRNIIDDGLFKEEEYHFSMKTIFSNFGSFVEITPLRGWQISVVQIDSLRGLLDFKPVVIDG